MVRHEVRFNARLSGDITHLVKAKNGTAAKERVSRAYPDQELTFETVKPLAVLTEG